MALLLELVANKYVLGSFSVLIALIVAYFKGHKASEKASEIKRIQAEAAQQSRLRAAEAKNVFLEKKGEKLNEIINNADSIDSLILLWNSFHASKSSGSSSDKKPD